MGRQVWRDESLRQRAYGTRGCFFLRTFDRMFKVSWQGRRQKSSTQVLVSIPVPLEITMGPESIGLRSHSIGCPVWYGVYRMPEELARLEQARKTSQVLS